MLRRAEELSLERLIEILQDREQPNGDVFKAITLFCEKLRPDSGDGGGIEICLKGEEQA